MAKLIKSPPTENSRWIRGDQIGKGSFGTVSLGFDRSNGQIFAVKTVPVKFSTLAQVEAIENEIAVLRSLSSPFIIEYYGDDERSESRNLHMEYVSGGTAAEFAKSGDDEEALKRYVWCLVSALEYIHSRGIVHCDVKGRNVLLDRDSRTAKLADFGSARSVDDRKDRIMPRGSPLWMAPEVVRGESQGREADVWALGCTVIEMVTGSPAWKDEGANTLRRIGYSDELPAFPTRLSVNGVDFLEKCLRKDPSQRWSCNELLQHPFLKLKSAVQIDDLSPRSVIQLPELEASDDEHEEELVSSSATGDRIGNLAGGSGANWESDGWVEVRCITVGFTGNEEAGASSVYLESSGAHEEFRSTEVSLGGGGLGGAGGYGDDELTVTAVESWEFSLTAVKRPAHVSVELLCLLALFILYYKKHQKCSNTRNIPFFMCYILFRLSTIILQAHSDFIATLAKLRHILLINYQLISRNGMLDSLDVCSYFRIRIYPTTYINY